MATKQGIRGIRQAIPSGFMIGRSSPGSTKGAPGLIPLPPLNQQPVIAGSGGKATQGGGTSSTPGTVGTSLPVPGQIPGTTTNDNATAGNIGEYIESNIAFASPTTGFTNGISRNVTSISLTAGDWDVCGSILTSPSNAGAVTDAISGISTTTGTLPDPSRYARWQGPGDTFIGLSVPLQRISIASTTTVYLVADAAFSAGTLAVCGTIRARRVR